MSEPHKYPYNNQCSTLRFGILCNGYILKKWQTKVIENLLNSDITELCLLVINAKGAEEKSFFKRINLWFEKKLFYRIFMKFFCKPDSMKNIDFSEKLQDIPFIKCHVLKKGIYSEYFSDNDIAKIRSYKLDFMLRFGFNIIRGDIIEAAKYGIWSYHHDDEKKYRGGPPCFWEIYNNDNINGAILQKLTNKLDCGIILKKGYFKTINNSYSDNIDNILYGSVKWPLQICVDIRNGVADYFSNQSSTSDAKIFKKPTFIQIVLFLVRLFINKINFHYFELFRSEQWNIGIIKKPITSFIENNISEKEIIWLPHQKHNYFKADGFAYNSEEKINILFEKFDYKIRKGIINKIAYTENTGFEEETTIIEKSIHLSYPYIVMFNDEIFCIPESYKNKQLDLYKINKLNWSLEFYKTILKNIDAVDSSLFYHNNIWWLFCTKNSDNSNINLYLYFSENIEGPYCEHPANPVKTDIRSSRPAGSLFISDGIVYRPAQDSSNTYGGRITINKITKLNKLEFAEDTVKYIEPIRKSLYNRGSHTISDAGNYTVIDGKRFIFVWAAFQYQLIRKIKKNI